MAKHKTGSYKSAKEIVLVVNPAAGKGLTKRLATPVLRSLELMGYSVRAVKPSSAQETETFVSGLPANSVVVALGGDGFMRNVAIGCIASDSILVPLPGGRGNDLCRYLGIGSDALEALKRLPQLSERHIDVGYVNGALFLGVACVGFDATVNQTANDTKFIRGSFVYAWAAIKTIFTYRALPLTIKTSKTTTNAHYEMVDVGNSGCYGGGVLACPQARIEDGELDLVQWQRVPRYQFPKLLKKAFKGKHVQHPAVSQVRMDWAEITSSSDELIPVYGDGDLIAHLPARYEIKPRQLRILA